MILYFVIAGLDPSIHAAGQLAGPYRLRMRRVSMDHRVKPGGDEVGDIHVNSSQAT
jgi:hypothetical protein